MAWNYLYRYNFYAEWATWHTMRAKYTGRLTEERNGESCIEKKELFVIGKNSPFNPHKELILSYRHRETRYLVNALQRAQLVSIHELSAECDCSSWSGSEEEE